MYRPVTMLCAAISGLMMTAAVQAGGSPPTPRFNARIIQTFGGPNSYVYSALYGRSLNNSGVAAGWASTALEDPGEPCFWDCYIARAYRWHDGKRTRLPHLPGGYNAQVTWITDRDLAIGVADNGAIDPIEGVPVLRTVYWRAGRAHDIGSLGGAWTLPNAANDRGEIAGVALNRKPDDFSMLGWSTQTQAFVWRNGKMRKLGTLGGTNSWAAAINERGQVAGWSYVNRRPTATLGVPRTHPFVWKNGDMEDLGTLGGSYAVVGSSTGFGGHAINRQGHVVGSSYLKGDSAVHAFLWKNGRMLDLGTLGGPESEAYAVNDAGAIVGRADDTPGSTDHMAFLWTRARGMIGLGRAPGHPCSTAVNLNRHNDVIIETGVCNVGGGPGMLWKGGRLYDLNQLVAGRKNFFIGDPSAINDRGEITAFATLKNGDLRAVVLIPCGERKQPKCD